MKNYRTVLHEAKDEFTEKKSRFIGAVMPIKTEEEALSFIAAKRKEYYDASHNVYAYILRDGTARFSDDGEPSGTAGMPVMEVLKKEGLADIVVVVTRYFGGTLLGAGGLVRAYGKGAKIAVCAGQIAEMLYSNVVSIKCSYELFGKIKHMIENRDCVTESTVYDAFVTVCVSVVSDDTEKLLKEITELSGGSAEAEIIGEKYAAKEIKN